MIKLYQLTSQMLHITYSIKKEVDQACLITSPATQHFPELLGIIPRTATLLRLNDEAPRAFATGS